MPSNSLLSGRKCLLWYMHLYVRCFEVDTSAALQHGWVARSLRVNFLDVLQGTSDFYKSYWIATAVAFILFLGGTISKDLSVSAQQRRRLYATPLTHR